MYFASLMVGGLSINLPNISAKKMAQVAERYPSDAAAIFVFDVWVLNDDRENNLKANLTSSPLHLVAAIDHEQTLLGRYGDMAKSLDALEALAVPDRHPLGTHLEQQHVEQWVARVQSMSDSDINDAVVLGYSVGGVHQRSQLRLAKSMKARRDSLPELVGQALS